MQVALERYADEGDEKTPRGGVNKKPPAQRVRPGAAGPATTRRPKKT
jgi:hypothetical protein